MVSPQGATQVLSERADSGSRRRTLPPQKTTPTHPLSVVFEFSGRRPSSSTEDGRVLLIRARDLRGPATVWTYTQGLPWCRARRAQTPRSARYAKRPATGAKLVAGARCLVTYWFRGRAGQVKKTVPLVTSRSHSRRWAEQRPRGRRGASGTGNQKGKKGGPPALVAPCATISRSAGLLGGIRARTRSPVLTGAGNWRRSPFFTKRSLRRRSRGGSWPSQESARPGDRPRIASQRDACHHVSVLDQ
jgi:hypothetical protein